MTINVPDAALSEWLDVLMPYQREQLQVFGAEADPEKAAEKWVSTLGYDNIANFGGSDPTPFLELLKAEFTQFICNEEAYAPEKEELSKHGDVSKLVLVTTVSSAIGAQIGIAASVLVPPVAVLLFLVGRMSINAYCTQQSELNDD